MIPNPLETDYWRTRCVGEAMEADAAGVAPIADPVGLLPIAMLQTCQRQR
jgi:hypothetical protein